MKYFAGINTCQHQFVLGHILISYSPSWKATGQGKNLLKDINPNMSSIGTIDTVDQNKDQVTYVALSLSDLTIGAFSCLSPDLFPIDNPDAITSFLKKSNELYWYYRERCHLWSYHWRTFFILFLWTILAPNVATTQASPL